MSTLAIVLVAVVGLLVVLFVGGMVANGRRRRATEQRFRERVAAADRDLAAAAAQDRGWDRAALDVAVRKAWAQRQGAGAIDTIALVSVRDLPGTDEDEAVFHVTSGGRPFELVLSRTGDVWS